MQLNRWPSLGVRRFVVFPLIVCFAAVVSSPLASAQEAEEETASSGPFAVINVAGVDRWLENVRFVFKTVSRPEISDLAEGALGNFNNLEGLDRKKPFGVMFYMASDLSFDVAAVGYLPIAKIETLAEMFSMVPVQIHEIEGEKDRYELIAGSQVLQARMRGGYAFVSDEYEVLDEELPDPEELTRTLTERYDLAGTVNLERIPKGTRSLFLSLLRTTTEAQLQQRDDEPDAAYRMRRAGGMSNLQLLDQVLTHGERLVLGWDVSPEQKLAVVELGIEARADSELSTYLENMASKPSRFAALFDDAQPMVLSFSWVMDKRRQDVFVEALKAARDQATRASDAEEPDAPSALGRIFEPLIATVEQGHLDAFAQFQVTGEGLFALAGGMKVVDGGALSAGLAEFVPQLADKPAFTSVRANADSHQGVALHRLEPANLGSQEQRMYGESAALTIGAGQQTFWFAFGGTDALMLLKQSMDRVAQPPAAVVAPSTVYPFQMTVNASPWLTLGRSEAEGEEAERGGVAREAFTPENDALRVDFRPTNEGGRLRLEFQEGFLRFIGLSAARRFDRSQL